MCVEGDVLWLMPSYNGYKPRSITCLASRHDVLTRVLVSVLDLSDWGKGKTDPKFCPLPPSGLSTHRWVTVE